MRRTARVVIVLVAVLFACVTTSCVPSYPVVRARPVVREIETPDWQYAVETDHYRIHSNISRELVERAAVVAERAYAGAAKRLHADDDDPSYVKTLERRLDELPKTFVRTWDDGMRQYDLADGLELFEWPSANTVRVFELPDGRRFPFWERAMYGRTVPVYLCRDRAELDAWFPNESGPGRGGWAPAAGVIGIITANERVYADLDNVAHEIGHQVLSYVVYGPPVWLDEGLAMYARVDADTGRYRAGLINAAALRTCAKAIEDGTLVPVETLVRMDFNAFHFCDEEWQHYAQSWALVHCLMRSKHSQIRGKFRRYLDELKKGRDALEALEELYDPNALQDEYVRYIKALWARERARRVRPRRRQNAGESASLGGRLPLGWRVGLAAA
jgi:hypothetical protein